MDTCDICEQPGDLLQGNHILPEVCITLLKAALDLQKKGALTTAMLDAMPPGTIFATGELRDEPGGLFMARTGRMLRWVAVSGEGMPDWTIYCHFADEYSVERVRREGDKVHTNEYIKLCVPCDEGAFERYRF